MRARYLAPGKRKQLPDLRVTPGRKLAIAPTAATRARGICAANHVASMGRAAVTISAHRPIGRRPDGLLRYRNDGLAYSWQLQQELAQPR